MSTGIDRTRVDAAYRTEIDRLVADHPRCAELAAAGRAHMPGGVPMLWMAKWPGPFPLHVTAAKGAHVVCADGIEHVDLCLGDTGAMCGHSPAPTVAAIRAQAVGFVYSWSRFSTIFSGFIIQFFLVRYGTTGVFAFIAGAMVVVFAVIGGLGPPVTRRRLEAIAR